MKKYFNLVVAVILLSLCVNCRKSANPKWVLVDIEVRDRITDELVDADIGLYFRYEDKKYANHEYEYETLGTTTDGLFSFEKKFPEKIGDAYVVARGNGYYYSTDNYQSTSDWEWLINDHQTLYITPIYRYEVAFKNVNCFDATDSLRLLIKDPLSGEWFKDTLLGCFDGAIPNAPGWGKGNKFDWIGHLYRNGAYSTIYSPYPLAPNTINQLVVEY